jgi:hypothetical protein
MIQLTIHILTTIIVTIISYFISFRTINKIIFYFINYKNNSALQRT